MPIVKMLVVWLMMVAATLGLCTRSFADTVPAASLSKIETALQNVTALVRPGQIGYATVWDGNKYIQCRRIESRELRCEAAGAVLQPSLERVLVPERAARLGARGWRIDPSFGSYVQIFPADLPADRIATEIIGALVEGYDAKAADLETSTRWVADGPCPPRNGPTQNLAGIVSDEPSMKATALRGCFYMPDPASMPKRPVGSTEALITLYGSRVTGEIQRLRINATQRVFAVFETGICYIQCAPENTPPSIYCEAQSTDTWPALAAVLTPERISLLHAAGYSDPGRAPNFGRPTPWSPWMTRQSPSNC